MDQGNAVEKKWSNHETWAAWLWLTSNAGPFRDWRESVGQYREEAWQLWASGEVTAWMRNQGIRSKSEITRGLLAEKIRAALSAYMTLDWPELCPPELRTALLDVDCGEIAAAMLAEKIPSPPAGAKYPVGKVVITPGAAEELRPLDIFAALLRHPRGDWGELAEKDRAANERSLERDLGLFSVYRGQDGTTLFYVVTEFSRLVTTVLLPGEY